MTKQELAKAIMWMMDKGYATGHGDSVVDLLQELEWQVAEREREACAKVVEADGLARGNEGPNNDDAIEALRQALAESANSTTDFVEPKASSQTEQKYATKVLADGTFVTEPLPLYTAPPKKEWVGLTVNEARKFYEKYTNREELIYAIDEFLEEKNGG